MKRVFIAATGRNIGKTSISIGIINYLLKRGYKVGYMKPISQRYAEVGERKIAEDAILMKKIFSLRGNLSDMSPFVIEHEDTTKYLMGKKKLPANKILKACRNIEKENDVMVIEGTGHAGIGSVFDLSNAQVAKLLNAPIIIVDVGGIGSTIDRIKLNESLFLSQGCKVLGIIINKVIKEKYDGVSELLKRWGDQNGLQMFCAIPREVILPAPTLAVVKRELKLNMLFDGKFNNSSKWNRQIEKTVVATTEADVLGDSVSNLNNNVLIITSCDRTDVILASLMLYQSGSHNIIGLVLSGNPPPKTIMDFIGKTGLPVFISEQDVYTLALSIHNLAVKITPEDKIKIDVLINLFMEYGALESFHEAIFGSSEMKLYWKDKVKLQILKLKNIFTSKKQ
ncbi:MAG TPA: hypothetical protein DHW42_11865 [Candidatus Marinimicrobia bacterium]|nr:hypothetical protein [Candidatus Neomarinimicrobiota bacterium]